MRSRLLSIAALAALALGTIAAPASAAGSTRYVDDDGTAGTAGCNGSRSVSSTIQGAVDASSPGDTVLVCPGRYPEIVDIDVAGLTVRAVTKDTAVLAPPAPDADPIVRIGARNVTLQWLRIVAPTTGSCTFAATGVIVDGVAGARVLSNRIVASTKGQTYGGTCGLASGVGVLEGSANTLIAHNIVRDFQLAGVAVYSAEARVIDNSLRFWHLDLVPCPAACVAGRPAAAISPTGVYLLNATGAANLNATSNGPDDTDQIGLLSDGILAVSSDGVSIRRNDLRGVTDAIHLVDTDDARIAGNVLVGMVPPEVARAARSARVTPARTVRVGLTIDSGSDNRIRGNHALTFDWGVLLLPGTSGNVLTDNDFTGNAIVDCIDRSDQAPADVSILNTWTDNLGNADEPLGLCTDAPVQTDPGSPT